MKNEVFYQFRDKTLDDFQTGDDQPLVEALAGIREYVEQKTYSTGRGLCLMGPAGVGKTFLACMVLKIAREQRHNTECMEYATYVELRKLKFSLDAMVRTGNAYAEDVERASHTQDLIDGVQARHLLLLDDIGREHESASGWSNEMLFDLIRYRYGRGKPTLLTTNCDVATLNTRYTDGFTSFLHECCQMVVVNGHDHR